jgi:hypothetical protein
MKPKVGLAVYSLVTQLLPAILLIATPVFGQSSSNQPTASIPYASIEGQVIDAQNSRPIPWANVVVRNAKKNSDARSFAADSGGHFLATNIRPGSYVLVADHAGYFANPYKRAFQPTIEVSAGQEMKGVLLRLLPTAVVAGQIVDENSLPLVHVEVKLLARTFIHGRMRLAVLGMGITDDRGEYRLYSIQPGDYYLLAEINPKLRTKNIELIATSGLVGVLERSNISDPMAGAKPDQPITYAPSFYPGTSDFLQAEALPVAAGDEAHVNFVCYSARSVSIKGTVVNGTTGGHAGNATVAAYWTDVLGEAAAIPAETKSDGSFEIRDLAPGRYTLRTSYSDLEGSYSDQREVEVGVHGLENLLLAVERDSAIEGQIVLSAPTPDFRASSVAVNFSPAGMTGDFRVVATAPRLDFAGSLKPGEHYRVSTASLPGDYYLKTVRVSGHDLLDLNNVTAAGPHEQIELVLNPSGGHVEGTVFDREDQPVSGYVLLVPEEANRNNSDLFRRARSDSKGKFILRGIPPGSYKLIAFEGYDAEELINFPDRLKEIEDRGERITITEGGKYSPVLKLISPD